jgi:hypothetical protein
MVPVVVAAVATAGPATAGEPKRSPTKPAPPKKPSSEPAAPDDAPKGKVVLVRPAGLPEVQVRLDGALVEGTEVAVTPGEHEIVASAPGRRRWSRKVSVDEKAPARVTIPRLSRVGPIDAKLPAARPLPLPAPPQGPPVAIQGGPDDEADDPMGSYALGGAFLGAGLAAVGVAVALGVAAINKRDEAAAFCGEEANDDVCSPQGLDLRSEGRDLALGSTLAIGFTPLTVLGAWTLATAPGMWRSRTLPEVKVEAGPESARLQVTGRF